jgi:hypothetical protein
MIKKIIIIVLFLYITDPAFFQINDGIPRAAGTSNNHAFAATKTKKKFKRKAPKTNYQEIKTDYLMPGFGFYSYEKTAFSPDAKDKGQLFNFNAKLQVKVSYMLLSLLAEYSSAPVKYSGTLPAGEKINGSKIDNSMYRLEYNMGFSYAFSERVHIVLPYTGLSYRLIRMEETITAVNPAVIARYRYEWFSIPIGVKFYYQLFQNFIAGIDISYRQMIAPRTTIYTKSIFRNSDPELQEDAHVKMKNDVCYRVELPMELYIFKYFGIAITPWYDYVSFGKRQYMMVMGAVPHNVIVSARTIETFGGTLAFVLYF